MSGCTFSSDDIVIKSPDDNRLYRLIQLENGLTALLIHDPEIYLDVKTMKKGITSQKKAAAAMCVGIGSFSDPLEAQGLAHFLEHMLFMGSTEFPDENEYCSYLSEHGGCRNAYTEFEHTCYHFEVKAEFLKGALARFSQFFVSPLLRIESMEKELLTIDSEFNGVRQLDDHRLFQLQCHTSSTGHPYNRFACGNKKSLVSAVEKGINLREKIVQLYRDYYHGGLMKLVVIGGESLDVLEQWVLELYGNIKKGPQVNLEFKAEGPIWKAGKLYRLEAVEDVHMLSLAWTLPCLRQYYLKKPEQYISHVLRHEGRGSLYFYLKARGWVTRLNAYHDRNGSSVAYVFRMIIYLTNSGLDKIYEIIGFVYQYIKLLRQASPQEWIFKELQVIGNMDFNLFAVRSQDEYASEFAEKLLHYAAEYVVYGAYVFKNWDAELIENVLGFFRPDNMRIDVMSKSFKSEDFQCEPWFGSHYTEEDISSSLMDLWRDPPEIDASLHLPAKNEFIPSDFSICSDTPCLNAANTSSPRCILDEPLVKLWYKLHRTPEVRWVNTYFIINLKGGYDDVKSSVLTKLYIDLLKDELNEFFYQARVAKLETSLSMSKDKLQLEFEGFSDKIPILLSKVLETVKNFLPAHDCFQVVKEDMERALKNTNVSPQSHSLYLRQQVLLQNFYDVDEKLHILNGLSVSDLKSFIPELFSQLYIEGFCHGDLSEEEAISLSSVIKTTFSVPPLPTALMYRDYCVCLPPAADLIRDASVKNKSETNSVISLYFQIKQPVESESTRLTALVDLFHTIVKEPLFNQLRTKEQLGYVVQCAPDHYSCGVLGFSFCIQSSKHNPIYLQGRLDNFINGLENLLEGLDDESFENYRGGKSEDLLVRDLSLVCQTKRLWYEILAKRYTLDSSKKGAKELGSIKKKDVINFYKTYFQQSSPKCRRLATRVWGCNTDLKEAEKARQQSSVQFIEDLAAFKMSSKFYDGENCKVAPRKRKLNH